MTKRTWPKPTATRHARGYDNTHVKARATAARKHRPTDPCARCGHPLGPMGSWLHYDHNDQRTGYLGFSHGNQPCPICGKRCNKVAGAIKGMQRWQQAKTKINKVTTLRW